MIIGKTIIDKIKEAVNNPNPELRVLPKNGAISSRINGTNTRRAQSPKTTDGTPASTSMNGLMILLNFFGAYSAIYIALSKEIGIAMSMEIAVTMSVSIITAKRPNSPEKGFHVEDTSRSERDSSESILREPFIRTATNNKNKKITDAVTNNINRVPKASYNFLVILIKLYANRTMKIIRNNANRIKLLKINKKIKERKRDIIPTICNLYLDAPL